MLLKYLRYFETVLGGFDEQAKKMYSSDNRSSTPDIPDNTSDSGSTDDARIGRPIRVCVHLRSYFFQDKY